MRARFLAVAELALAGAALVATAISWLHTRSTVAVAPVADGQPITTSVIYHPGQLVLTLLLATIAGIFAVLGMARLRRAQRDRDREESTVSAVTAVAAGAAE